MSTSLVVLIAAIVVVIAVLLLLRSRKQRVSLSDTAAPAPLPRREVPPVRMADAVLAEPDGPVDEGRDVAGEAAAAIEDVVGQFIGVEAHHDAARDAGRTGPGDTLTQLKGLGPKAATRLGELGVTSFAQMAAWDAGDVAAIDAQMGAFKGRIVRDRWVEQARLLSTGDRDGFEAAFGKLGG